jgi:CelD/BcsL family acetyltransferase involved in cellulose biosynthesis
MAAASEAGATRMEYLGGNERYKKELSDRLDPLYQGYGLARGPLGHAYVARARLSVTVRKRLKQNERLHQLYTSGALRVRRSARPASTKEDQAAA